MKIFNQIQWGLITFLVALLIYSATFGAENIRHQALLEAFAGPDAQLIETRQAIAKRIPELFTDDFYRASESEQYALAEKFWVNRLAPLSRFLPPAENATTKTLLLESIQKLNSAPPARRGLK